MSTPSSRPSVVHFTTKAADGKGDSSHTPVINVAAYWARGKRANEAAARMAAATRQVMMIVAPSSAGWWAFIMPQR